jgi:hypothetical protein
VTLWSSNVLFRSLSLQLVLNAMAAPGSLTALPLPVSRVLLYLYPRVSVVELWARLWWWHSVSTAAMVVAFSLHASAPPPPRQYDGFDPEKPLLIAIKGQIYDVSHNSYRSLRFAVKFRRLVYCCRPLESFRLWLWTGDDH